MPAFPDASPVRGLRPPIPSNDDAPHPGGPSPSVAGVPSNLPLVVGLLLILLIASGIGAAWMGRRSADRQQPVLELPVAPAAAVPDVPGLDVPEDERPTPTARPEPLAMAPPTALPVLPTLPGPFMSPLPEVRTRDAAAPALIIDLGAAPAQGTVQATPGSRRALGAPASNTTARQDALRDLALEGDEGDQPDRVSAVRLQRPHAVVVQGTIIPGVLETAINSDLPGYARAVVSLDVLSFDRTSVLIPRGSRLIGKYQSDLVPGQSRVFVVWTRLVRPDGASIQLDSPAMDRLGRGGLEGRVDRRFFERYGGSALLSSLNAGLAALAPRSPSQIIVGSTTSGGVSGGGGREVSPVVRVPQGAPLRIFVARDLDFSSVGASPLTATGRGG